MISSSDPKIWLQKAMRRLVSVRQASGEFERRLRIDLLLSALKLGDLGPEAAGTTWGELYDRESSHMRRCFGSAVEYAARYRQ